MDTRSIGAILLKIAGLLIIAYAVAAATSYFPLLVRGSTWSFPEIIGTLAVSLGPLLLLGIVLWFFPGSIANRIVSGPPTSEPPTESRRFELIALGVLGLFLVAAGFTDLVRDAVYIIAVQRESPDAVFIPAAVASRIAAAVTQLGIGAVLCIGAPGVWRLIERLRG